MISGLYLKSRMSLHDDRQCCSCSLRSVGRQHISLRPIICYASANPTARLLQVVRVLTTVLVVTMRCSAQCLRSSTSWTASTPVVTSR
jgi:hypothetical protein